MYRYHFETKFLEKVFLEYLLKQQEAREKLIEILSKIQKEVK